MAPAIIATVSNATLLSSGLAYSVFALSGILAGAIVSLQFVLSARINLIETRFSAARMLRLHRTMALVATLCVLSHVGYAVWIKGSWDLILHPAASWPIQLGRLAAVSLIVTCLFALGRRRIPINNADWRFFHGILAWIILLSGFAHSIVIGESLASPLFALTWIGYLTLAISAWGLKFLRSRQR